MQVENNERIIMQMYQAFSCMLRNLPALGTLILF